MTNRLTKIQNRIIPAIDGTSDDSRFTNLDYDLEIDRVCSLIKQNNAKIVGIQLPDGLKQFADVISSNIESKTSCTCIIWAGSHFGACDLASLENFVDLLIVWGHSPWNYS